MSVDRRDLLKGAAVVPFGFAGCLGLSNSNSESSSEPDAGEQIELTFDGGSTATTDDGGWRLSTQPKFHFSEPTTIDQEVRFETENLDTGDQMTVEVEGEDSFETEWAKLSVVNPDGTFPNETFPSVVVVYPDSFERFETSVEGDDTAFTQIQRASYRTTMYRADAEVGSTEYEMTMNHEFDPKYTVTDETIKASFAAGKIPTGGSVRTVVKPGGGGGVRYKKGGYDEEANRFTTEVENPGLSETQDNRLRLIVEDPDTGRPAIAFSSLID